MGEYGGSLSRPFLDNPLQKNQLYHSSRDGITLAKRGGTALALSYFRPDVPTTARRGLERKTSVRTRLPLRRTDSNVPDPEMGRLC